MAKRKNHAQTNADSVVLSPGAFSSPIWISIIVQIHVRNVSLNFTNCLPQENYFWPSNVGTKEGHFGSFTLLRVWLWSNFHTKNACVKCWWNCPLGFRLIGKAVFHVRSCLDVDHLHHCLVLSAVLRLTIVDLVLDGSTTFSGYFDIVQVSISSTFYAHLFVQKQIAHPSLVTFQLCNFCCQNFVQKMRVKNVDEIDDRWPLLFAVF